jgi:hypothetical protein
MLLDEIPGLKRALTRARGIENSLRDAAFLPVLEEIDGLPVRQLTLRHLLILSAIHSPFLEGGEEPTAEDVAAFLWVVSIDYNPKGHGRAEFLGKIGAREKGLRFWRAINRYLDRALMDRPPIKQTGKVGAGISMATSIIDELAGTYGWDDESILDKPVARIFQYIKLRVLARNPNAPKFSRLTDRVKRRGVARYQARNPAEDSSEGGSDSPMSYVNSTRPEAATFLASSAGAADPPPSTIAGSSEPEAAP